MKFICSIDVNVPVAKAIALYNDPAYFKEWQDGFVSYEQLSGRHNEVNSKAEITFVNGKRKIVLTETTQVSNPPAEITRLYEHEHMINTMTCHFEELPDHKTKVVTGIAYIKFIGLMPKIMSLLMAGMFKKQSQKWLDQFKAFAEAHDSPVL